MRGAGPREGARARRAGGALTAARAAAPRARPAAASYPRPPAPTPARPPGCALHFMPRPRARGVWRPKLTPSPLTPSFVPQAAPKKILKAGKDIKATQFTVGLSSKTGKRVSSE